MGFDGSFKELVLSEDVLDGKAPAPPVPAGLSDPTKVWPELEVVASSYSDCVICHRMYDHDDLLFLLMSRGQFYVRDADGIDQPRRLGAEELDRHLASAGQGIEAVPWSTAMKPGRAAAEAFLEVAGDPVFQRLARSGQVVAEYGVRDPRLTQAPMYQVIANERKGVTKAIISAVSARVGEAGAAAALGAALGLWSPWTRDADVAVRSGCRLSDYHDALDVFEYPQAFLAMTGRFGLDGARDYLKGFLALANRESWQVEQQSLLDFLDLTERLGVEMKPSAFVAYATEQRHAQGANIFDGAHWLDLWGDTLAMEDLVRGGIADKYPAQLIVLHDQLIREGVRVRHAISSEDVHEEEALSPFEAHRRELDANSFADDRFCIRPPRDAEEMLEEARRQHNCLAGYVRAFEHGDTDIYLMRSADRPDVPLVTVEVRDGRVRQAFQGSNRNMTREQATWLNEWCTGRQIRPQGYYDALYVGLEYDEAERPGRRQRTADELMAAARREDVLHNRPTTWRRRAR